MATLVASDATKGADHPHASRNRPQGDMSIRGPLYPLFPLTGHCDYEIKTGVFTGHGEVGDDLPGQGPQRIPALHMVFHGQFGWVVEIV